jgi:hypothetical protein
MFYLKSHCNEHPCMKHRLSGLRENNATQTGRCSGYLSSQLTAGLQTDWRLQIKVIIRCQCERLQLHYPEVASYQPCATSGPRVASGQRNSLLSRQFRDRHEINFLKFPGGKYSNRDRVKSVISNKRVSVYR